MNNGSSGPTGCHAAITDCAFKVLSPDWLRLVGGGGCVTIMKRNPGDGDGVGGSGGGLWLAPLVSGPGAFWKGR